MTSFVLLYITTFSSLANITPLYVATVAIITNTVVGYSSSTNKYMYVDLIIIFTSTN
jgi:hypothetical protein